MCLLYLILFLSVCCGATQQEVLDTMAKMISEALGTECVAPKLENCANNAHIVRGWLWAVL